jgi:hypothetical protein
MPPRVVREPTLFVLRQAVDPRLPGPVAVMGEERRRVFIEHQGGLLQQIELPFD